MPTKKQKQAVIRQLLIPIILIIAALLYQPVKGLFVSKEKPVETKADGYQIKKEGDDKTVDLIFDKADKTWSVESDGETAKLLKFTEDDKVVMYLPDGKEMNVELNQAGVLAFRQIADNYNFFAAR
jgi:hypothetical protein